MTASVEFEHFIGINAIPSGALFHPDGQHYIFSNGANLVVADLMDSHAQEFLRGHDDHITTIALSTSGRLIATGQLGENADIIVWDFETRQAIYRFEEHDHGIQAVAFSEDEKILASIGNSDDSNLMFWDMSNGCIIASSARIPTGTKCISFGGFVKDIKRRNTSHYQLCSAGKDGLLLWDLEPITGDLESSKVVGDVRATINRDFTSVTFSEDYEYLYGATTSGDFAIASLKAHKILKAITATRMTLHAILPFKYGVVIGCGDCTVKVFDDRFEKVGEVKMDGEVVSLSLSPDNLELLTLSSTGTVTRANLNTLKYIILSESHTESIVKVAFDDGRSDRFATASMDGTIKVWDIVEYIVISTSKARREQEAGAVPLCLAFADILLSGWSDGRVLAHSAETGESLWILDNAHHGGVTALALSHNRRFILTGGPQGEVRLWELRTRELISHLKEHKQMVNALALFDDDTMALSASRDRCILRWDLRSENRVHCHMQRMGGINSIAIAKDQTHTLSVGQEKKLVVWNNVENDLITQVSLDEENDEGHSIAISHDGRLIATGGSAGVLRIWELDSNNGVHFISDCIGHSKGIREVVFSADDKQIVSVGDDGAIFVWNVFVD